MKILLFAALFFSATHMRVCAQDTTAYEGPFQAVQVDFAYLPLGVSHVLSWSAAVDIDFELHKHAGGAVTLYGCQLGYSQFGWPYIKYGGKDWHYSGNDFDLLLRHTYKCFKLRTDIVTGLCIRDGDYEDTRTGEEFWGRRELSVTAGLKIGGALTIMIHEPALALRVKAQGRLFGFKTLEGGAIGFGLVFGWQRDD